jgi:hypothetical protein
MKNALKVWVITALVPVFALAQSSLDEEVNAELDRMYQGGGSQAQAAPAAKITPQVIQQPVAAPAQASQAQGVQVTVVPVQAAPMAVAPQAVAIPTVAPSEPLKQPTTVIEATPLVESKAEKLRKSRADAELSTEQGIVEKLEQSRLEDEKKRAEVLFGDKFNTLMNQGQPQPAPVAAPAPAPMLAPIPVVVPEQIVETPVVAAPIVEEKKDPGLAREEVRAEISTAIADLKKEQEAAKPKSQTYMSLMAGSSDYPDAVNVKPQYSFGIGIGRQLDDHLVLEGSFQYSNFDVEQRQLNGSYYSGSCYYDYQGNCYPRITEMNQYSTGALVKYQILSGMFRPEVGGLMSYTYRTFTDKQFGLSDATVASHALDLGIMGGFTVALTESFSIGLDMRYMWNMTNKVEATALQKSALYQGYSQDTPIEQLSYWNSSIVGRATF